MSIKTTYKNIPIAHEKKSIPLIQSFLSNFSPELIIEFGSSYGGFTLVLHDAVPEIQIYSYDNRRRPEKWGEPTYSKPNITFYKLDIFIQPVSLVELCKDPRKKLLYCDNGNKIKEFTIFGKYLNSGDMIGVHDWNIEIKQSDIDTKDFIHVTPKELLPYLSRFWIKK